MKTVLKLNFGLWLAIGILALRAQVPPAVQNVARPTNATPTNLIPATNSLFSRSANFGRLGTNTPATNANTRVIVPAPSPAVPTAAAPGAQPRFPGAPAGPGPALPGRTGPVNPLLPAAPPGMNSTNFDANKVVARGSTNDIPKGMMSFQELDLSQAFDLYAQLTHRTVLRSPQVPQTIKVTIRNETPLTQQEAINALDTIFGLNQITMVPQGDKFIKVVPQASLPQEAAPFRTNEYSELPDSQAPIAQIVTLKNLQPEEATSILQPFAKLPNSIIGVKGSPVLVLRDYSENVKRMLEMLEKVDVAMPLEVETVVIPIKYALAGEIASVLSGLGATTGSGLSGGAASGGLSGGGFAGTSGFGGTGGRGFGGTGGAYGSGYGGSTYGNTGVGGNRFGTGVGTFGGATGVGGAGGTGTGAFGTQRSAFGNRLNQAVAGAVNRAGGGGAPGDFTLIGNAKIIPDERSNALLVFADRHDLVQISNIIAKLDVVLPQVLIEALILEVNLGDSQNIGVSMIQRQQQFGDLKVAGSSLNGIIVDPGSIANIGTNIGGSGFTYVGKLSDDFDFAVNAVANDNRINVLSRPRIVTSTAKPASIFVGETRPYVTGTYFSDFAGSGSRSQYAQTQIGINLNVLPIINQEGLVVMDIAQDISQVGGTVKVDNNDVPITINRNANSYVAVHDRDTIMLGGFISTTKTKSKSGVPYLKDIPGLGVLFRSSSENVSRVELMVLIRPTVLPTPEAAALHTAQERDRHPNIRRAEREVDEFQQKQLERERKDEEKAERQFFK